jgi:hypothetical protein
LYAEGVDLGTLQIDMQQLMHVCRDEIKSRERSMKSGDVAVTLGKKPKTRTMYLQNALEAAYFLSHKARSMEEGLFADLKMPQKEPSRSRS